MIAICTAFSQAMIAIDIDGKQDFLTIAAKNQADSVLSALDGLLQKNDVSIAQNHCYGVVIGPGSFTGLRIGLSLVKGLCAGGGEDDKVVAMSSLSLLARQVVSLEPQSDDFVCALNALSGLVFVAKFAPNGQKIGDDRLISLDEFEKMPQKKFGLQGENICCECVNLTPQVMLEYAQTLCKSVQFESAKTLSPTYLRKSQAETTLEQKAQAKKS